MSKILLSINPKYVEKIFLGEKIYEYRKLVAKKKPDKIVIYSTAPISMVVGEAEVKDIIIKTPDELWSETKDFGGVSEKFFFSYYENKDKAVAYELENVTIFEEPKELIEFGISFAPQSFVYL